MRKMKLIKLVKHLLMAVLVFGLVAVFAQAEPEKETLPDLELATVGFAKTSFQAEVCNEGTKDVAGFKILFQAKGKINILTYLPGLATGSCTTLYSWGYSYFGLEKGDLVSLTVEVDPYNEIAELREDNNKQWARPWKVPGEKEEADWEELEEAMEETAEEETAGGGGVVGEPETGAGGEAITEPITEPAKECLSGCNFEGKCLPVGTRLNNFYCSWSGDKFRQQPVGTACENNYECSTNSCISGKCIDLEKQLEEQKNLLKKILDWLAELFGKR